MSVLDQRYDFVYLFDVQDGNPNGDPDAGNLPRIDPETGQGIVTDVCLKRKLRNYVQLAKGEVDGFDVYVKEKAVLGRAHFQAFKNLSIPVGEEARTSLTDSVLEELRASSLPDGFELVTEPNGGGTLVVSATVDKQEVAEELKSIDLSKAAKSAIQAAVKSSKPRKPTGPETEKGRDEMCRVFFDVRTFGAVMSLKSAPNCGQVRGPVQLTFSRSIDPIVPLEHSITRMAVATEAEAEKQKGDNRTMGRKATIPYGLYRAHGFVSASLAEKTGFTSEDLDLIWEGLGRMFDEDRSAARGLMSPRGLFVFEHASKLGNAPAHQLFERIVIHRKDTEKPPRAFSDYEVRIDSSALPEGVSMSKRI